MKIFVTRKIPNRGIEMLRSAGHEIVISPHDRVLTPDELISGGTGADAVLAQLTDKVTRDVLAAWKPSVRIIANYAVGYDNIDVAAAKELGIVVTNTPDVLTETVAEHAFALMLSIAHRVVEADKFMRAGKYIGWEPELLLGTDLSHKTLGILGLGRIGSLVAHHGAKGFNMRVLYYDVKRNENFEKEIEAQFRETPEAVLKEADFISIHVPLLPTTKHLINAERLRMMKPTAYLVNTSRGPIVDEHALAEALRDKVIKGAALDVFENEPAMDPTLKDLDNVIVTPHIASATEDTRQKMGEVAAKNIIAVLENKAPANPVQ
ncbi:MAG: D-isomer specific 2-hydroxyacid dehydrogenase, NAD-binding protein [Parcubacteria group bacterium GW2011_GWB1_52_7]|nr:MAG: D-isomer specific 2-hydroxyacid dehydrogenase, NAD-binding protein [Parcubacteria group bacterium GW2011_GWA1_51_12]KKW28052.1 MAG: D-isomer specific 2-hydroxyacid dehydrogenase, NAD-binding protein [Parcubacteria group bacterium GW2011_GWB1_52_7]